MMVSISPAKPVRPCAGRAHFVDQVSFDVIHKAIGSDSCGQRYGEVTQAGKIKGGKRRKSILQILTCGAQAADRPFQFVEVISLGIAGQSPSVAQQDRLFFGKPQDAVDFLGVQDIVRPGGCDQHCQGRRDFAAQGRVGREQGCSFGSLTQLWGAARDLGGIGFGEDFSEPCVSVQDFAVLGDDAGDPIQPKAARGLSFVTEGLQMSGLAVVIDVQHCDPATGTLACGVAVLDYREVAIQSVARDVVARVGGADGSQLVRVLGCDIDFVGMVAQRGCGQRDWRRRVGLGWRSAKQPLSKSHHQSPLNNRPRVEPRRFARFGSTPTPSQPDEAA